MNVEQPPPTLEPPTAEPTVAPTPSPVLDEPPVLWKAEPEPNSTVGRGETRIAVEVRGFSDLAQITASLNGLPVGVEVERQDGMHWIAFLSRPLEPGEYDVRMAALDNLRRVGNVRWQFKVAPDPTPTVTPPPSPTPVPSPTLAVPVPTQGPPPSQTPLVITQPTAALPAPLTRATPAPIPLPVVRGMRFEDARTQLVRSGLQVQSKSVPSHAPPGIVVDQSPKEGSLVPPGATIVLSVSTGP